MSTLFRTAADKDFFGPSNEYSNASPSNFQTRMDQAILLDFQLFEDGCNGEFLEPDIIGKLSQVLMDSMAEKSHLLLALRRPPQPFVV